MIPWALALLAAGACSPELSAAIEAARSRHHLPGIAMVVRHGGQSCAVYQGLAELEHQVPVGPQTVFGYASVTKPLTATLVMRLAAGGLIELDTPLAAQAPLMQAATTITPRQVLSHTSGIAHWRGDEVAHPVPQSSLREATVATLARPRTCRPGACWHYSSPAWNLLGSLVEHTTGRSYFDAMQHQLLAGAGMDSVALNDPWQPLPQRARGYWLHPNGKLLHSPMLDVTDRMPAGGLAGTAEDLAAFAAALLDDRLLSPARRDAMWEPQRLADGEFTRYGLGWRVGMEGGQRHVWHGGSQTGYSAHLRVIPQQHRAVVILTNRGGVDLERLAVEILRLSRP